MKRSRTLSLAVSLLVGALVLAGVGLALIRAPQGTAQEQGPLIPYPDFPPTPTVGPNPTSPAGLASAQVLVASDFARADALTGWQVADQSYVIESQAAAWAVADGHLVQDYAGQARNPSTHETVAVTGAADWTDYTVQVSFYDEYNGRVGLVARYTGEEPTQARYYRVRLLQADQPTTPKLVLEKVVDGVATPLAQVAEAGFRQRAWHTLALRVRGGSLWVLLDGQVLTEAQDATPLPAGRAGVYTYAIGGIFFDDFVVTTP